MSRRRDGIGTRCDVKGLSSIGALLLPTSSSSGRGRRRCGSSICLLTSAIVLSLAILVAGLAIILIGVGHCRVCYLGDFGASLLSNLAAN